VPLDDHVATKLGQGRDGIEHHAIGTAERQADGAGEPVAGVDLIAVAKKS
jgi:hypothetical protein